MKQHKNILLIIFFLVFGVSCKGCQEKKLPPIEPVSVSLTGPGIKGLGLAGFGKKPEEITFIDGQYWHLKGVIGSQQVTIDLIKKQVSEPEAEDNTEACGSFFEDAKQEPVEIFCKWKDEEVEIIQNVNNEDVGIFNLRLNSDQSFTGTWNDTKKSKSQNVSLKQDEADSSLKFNVRSYQSFSPLFHDEAGSPKATISVTLLSPSSEAQEETSHFLKEAFLTYLYEETDQKKTFANADDFARNAVSEYFSDYSRSFDDEDKESLKNEDGTFGADLDYTNTSYTTILFNQNHLLSVALFNYDYSGGAHGNYASALISYDLTQKKVFTLYDIFSPGFESKVQKALEKSAKKTLVEEDTSLGAILNTETIEATSNFCITEKGILFDYPPYEIASFAQGEIRLFVSFEEINGVLKPEFKKRMGL